MDPDNFKKGPNDVTRFIKSDKEKKNYYLDEARIEEEAKYDGFYAVATNIFDMKETEVLDISQEDIKSKIVSVSWKQISAQDPYIIAKKTE